MDIPTHAQQHDRLGSSVLPSSYINPILKEIRVGFAQITKQSFRQVMATPPTITAGGATSMAAGYQNYPFGYAAAAAVYSGTCYHELLTNNGAGPVGDNTTTNAAGTTFGANTQRFSFIHTGKAFELTFSGAARTFLIKVDGEYVSLTPTIATSGFFKYAFPTAQRRRIDIINYIGNSTSLPITGVNVGANDSIFKAPVRGPRTILISDSFLSNNNSFAYSFAENMGWDDVWGSGVSGTGYIATNGGAAQTFGQRIQHDCIQYNPGVVGIVGSVNDFSQTYADLYAAALSLYNTLKAGLPGAIIFASPTMSVGADGMNSGMLTAKLAMKTAAAAAGIYWVDIIEQPKGRTTITGTVFYGDASGQPYVTLSTAWGSNEGYGLLGATISLRADDERHLVIAVGNNSGKTKCTCLTNLTNTANAGDAFSVVGPSYLTGIGKVTANTTLAVAAVATNVALTVASSTGILNGHPVAVYLDDGTIHISTVNGVPVGNVVTITDAMPSAAAIGADFIDYSTLAGNASLYVSNDGVHPSADGHIELGKAIANTLLNVLVA